MTRRASKTSGDQPFPQPSRRRPGSQEVPAGQFKATCLALMDRVREQRAEFVVTKHGKPVAKLVPVSRDRRALGSPFGWMKGSVTVCGDIVGPSGAEWEAVDRDGERERGEP